MLRNYILIALRNMIRNRLYSFLNITGLAVGAAACLLILLYVQDELSFDRFHDRANDIYRMNMQIDIPREMSAVASSGPLGKTTAMRSRWSNPMARKTAVVAFAVSNSMR